jgi:hypothetical protein
MAEIITCALCIARPPFQRDRTGAFGVNNVSPIARLFQSCKRRRLADRAGPRNYSRR